MTHVDGIHPRGAAPQQDVGEAAGRGAQIERHQSGRVDGEVIHIAAASLVPPRETYGTAGARTSIGTSGATVSPGLSSRRSPLNTCPASTRAWALDRFSARPRSTMS